tara:strand:+ start:22499 stop:23806 length:1308 start_codon:yes stop_codon:yes gene_type:complete
MGLIYEINSIGAKTATVNSSSVVEVSQASDLPATLAANTTYVIRGEVATSTPIAVTNSGCSIVGLDRNRDKLIWNGLTGTTMLTVTDVDFDLENLCLSSNNTGSVLIAADNYNFGSYNDGRSKVFTINNCQFRNCFDIASFDGFDLVDISNTLVWYCEAPNFGIKFTNTSKIEITSCEIIRWFRESTIPTPANYATCPMIELVNGTSNFGAVNINGCVVHPQQTQDGIKIDTASGTGFGTISSNAFVNIGLTTGKIFLPEASGLPDYSQAATYNYDVFANQGVLNSTSGTVSTLSANATTTSVTTSYGDIDTGASTVDQSSVRFTVGTDGVLTYNGTKQVYCSIHASVSLDSGGNDNTYTVAIYKDSGAGFVLLVGSESSIQFDGTGGLSLDVGTIPISYGTLFNNGDEVKMQIKKASGGASNITVTDYQLVIRE